MPIRPQQPQLFQQTNALQVIAFRHRPPRLFPQRFERTGFRQTVDQARGDLRRAEGIDQPPIFAVIDHLVRPIVFYTRISLKNKT